MYLHSLSIQRLKRLRALNLDLTLADGSPRPWTVIVGANGTGKSSILQAIGLVASGRSYIEAVVGGTKELLRDRRGGEELFVSASFGFAPEAAREPDLLPELRGSMGRGDDVLPNPPGDLRVRATARLGMGREGWRLSSGYRRASGAAPRAGEEPWGRGYREVALPDGPGDAIVNVVIDPLSTAREEGTRGWFVAGYGTSRALPPASTRPDLGDPAVSRLRGLFDPAAPLTSFNFASLSAPREGWARDYARAVGQALRAADGRLLPNLGRLELRGTGERTAADLLQGDRYEQQIGPDRLKLPAGALAHGHQSTLAWVSDLIGHILLASDGFAAPKDMTGLVLIDELDLHLHPSWQVSIVGTLRQIFPRLQFVVTTHSPLVLASARPDEIVHLVNDPLTGDVVASEAWRDDGDARLMTPADLLNTYFDVEDVFPTAEGQAMRDYCQLARSGQRSEDEEQTLQRAAAVLRAAGIAVPFPVRVRGAAGG